MIVSSPTALVGSQKPLHTLVFAMFGLVNVPPFIVVLFQLKIQVAFSFEKLPSFIVSSPFSSTLIVLIPPLNVPPLTVNSESVLILAE